MSDTPKPLQGIWKLTSPDGRVWAGESPLRCVSMEQADRIPATVRLQRIMEAADEPAASPAVVSEEPSSEPECKRPVKPLKKVQVTMPNGDSALLVPERAYFSAWAVQEMENTMKGAAGVKATLPPGVVIPPAPPECETEDEKTAYAFGYWQGLHAARTAGVWAKQYDDGTWAACRGNEVITPPTYPTAEAALAAVWRAGGRPSSLLPARC